MIEKVLRPYFFTSLQDPCWQAGVDILGLKVKSSVELFTRLLALPTEVFQQLCQTHFGGNTQVPELQEQTWLLEPLQLSDWVIS